MSGPKILIDLSSARAIMLLLLFQGVIITTAVTVKACVTVPTKKEVQYLTANAT